MADTGTMTHKERFAAILQVARISFKTAPMAVVVQLVSAVINAVLPIVTAYFAALTTTALAEAFAGDGGAGERVVMYVLVTAALGILSTSWSTVQGYVDQVLRYKIEAAVSDGMYEHFLQLEFWRYDDKETIDTYDKAVKFSHFFQYLFSQFAQIFGQTVGLITAVIALTIVSPWLGLIILAALVPGFIIQFKISRAQSAHWKKNVDVRRSIWQIEGTMQRPQQMAELRLYNMAKHLLDIRRKLRDRDDKVRIDFERTYILQRLGADVISSAAEVVALITIVIQIIHHAQPIGQFIYVQQLVSRVMSSASGLIYAINSIDEDLSNLVEYRRFTEMPIAVGGTKVLGTFKEDIAIENISFRYPTAKADVLKGLSFTISKGDHIAIVGENGAGKSTLIKLLTGLYTVTDGVILVDGTPIQDYDVSSWHRQLGVLQQDFIEYGFATARENVHFGDVSRRFNLKRFDEAIDMAEARDFLEKLPNGVDNYVSTWMEDDEGNKGTDLSGGQWQRLALARNFYRDSPIIILDEPTSAIDALAEARIFKHLFEQNDKTVITISHRLSTVKKADKIYMLQAGKIVERGTYGELIKAEGAFYKMFESQL